MRAEQSADREGSVTSALREVRVRAEAPEPVLDPTLGVRLRMRGDGVPRHRLVVIGDSLSHGFQSGAVTNTAYSFPAIIAYELGCLERFRRPAYYAFGGLPFNLENFARFLERRFPDGIGWRNAGAAAAAAYRYLVCAKRWWEHGPGARVPSATATMHNLSVYGWDLRDVIERDADLCRANIADGRNGDGHPLLISHANDLAALRVLASACDRRGRTLSMPAAAKALGDDGGIETLIVFVGNNNSLTAMTRLQLAWSGEHYRDLAKKDAYTVWRPSHFRSELRRLAEAVARVNARHVVWGTLPHVTILPVARGVGGKEHPGSPYFRFYTRPWIDDAAFDPRYHPHLTALDARLIDAAVDAYNEAIVEVVRDARCAGLDWLLCDIAALGDLLAERRYGEDPSARPRWWRPLALPGHLQAVEPRLTTHFFSSRESGRVTGGLVSLDGIHPTTIGYGLFAQCFIQVMTLAGVRFAHEQGAPVDFGRLLAADRLVSSPPKSLHRDFEALAWIEEKIGLMRRTLRWGVTHP